MTKARGEMKGRKSDIRSRKWEIGVHAPDAISSFIRSFAVCLSPLLPLHCCRCSCTHCLFACGRERVSVCLSSKVAAAMVGARLQLFTRWRLFIPEPFFSLFPLTLLLSSRFPCLHPTPCVKMVGTQSSVQSRGSKGIALKRELFFISLSPIS